MSRATRRKGAEMFGHRKTDTMTDKEVARLFGISEAMVREMVQTGELTPVGDNPGRFAKGDIAAMQHKISGQHQAFRELMEAQRDIMGLSSADKRQ